jgi:hypothetical protein
MVKGYSCIFLVIWRVPAQAKKYSILRIPPASQREGMPEESRRSAVAVKEG